jgi:hypothetical protein
VTILYLAPGLLAAFLVSKLRKQFLTRWPWTGLGIFLIVISPYLIWELANSRPTLEYRGNHKTYQLQDVTFSEYMLNILLGINPLVFLLSLIGLGWVFLSRAGRPYVVLGVTFLVMLGFLFYLQAKYFMLAELFIPLLAAGSLFVEERLSGAGRRGGVRIGMVACLMAAGLIVAPSCRPILGPQDMERYGEVFGFLYKPSKVGPFAVRKLPAILENRVGWDELTRVVAKVYNDLPEEERAVAGIYADYFGPAGAINHYGPQYGLPEAVTGHLNYYLWGPGSKCEVMIIATQNIGQFYLFFEDIRNAGFFENPYASPANLHIETSE